MKQAERKTASWAGLAGRAGVIVVVNHAGRTGQTRLRVAVASARVEAEAVHRVPVAAASFAVAVKRGGAVGVEDGVGVAVDHRALAAGAVGLVGVDAVAVVVGGGGRELGLFAENFGLAENFGHYCRKFRFYTFYSRW